MRLLLVVIWATQGLQHYLAKRFEARSDIPQWTDFKYSDPSNKVLIKHY